METRKIYFALIFGLIIFGTGIASAAAPNPGHLITEIEKCNANQVLKMDSSGSAWSCSSSSGSSQWISDQNTIHYDGEVSSGYGSLGINIGPVYTLDVRHASGTATAYIAGNLYVTERVGVGTTSPVANVDARSTDNNGAIFGMTSGTNYNAIQGQVDGANAFGISGVFSGTGQLGTGGAIAAVSGSGGKYGVLAQATGGSNARYGVYASISQGATDDDYGVYCSIGTGTGKCGGNRPWTDTSDERLKKDIKTITHPLDKILKLRGVSFYWKEDSKSSDPNLGFIAQEVLPVVPEVVSKNGEGYYAMDTSQITALLVEAMQEQQTQIEQLKKENAELQKSAWEQHREISELRNAICEISPNNEICD